LTSFLDGLNLPLLFPSADNCTNSLIYLVDDEIEFRNNISLELFYTEVADYRPVYPIMAFFKLMATNFSEMFPACWNMTDQIIDYTQELLTKTQNSFNNCSSASCSHR